MWQTPKVSIVVAAYNVAPYLTRCLDSLLVQSERSIEVLIVDDGSTDETPTITQEFVNQDPRAIHIRRANGGLSVARNTGLQVARGEFVCFIDGDDWVEPNMIELMLSSCQESGAQVAIAGAIVDFHDQNDELVRSEKRLLPEFRIQSGSSVPADVFDDNMVNLLGYAWNKIYRREWLQDLGIVFEEGLTLVEDIDFNARVLPHAESTTFVPDALYHYIQRPRQTLGTAHDRTFLSKRMRAIDSVDSLLGAWGVDQEARLERRARSSSRALWSASRSVSKAPGATRALREMIEQPEAERLLAYAQENRPTYWRGVWSTQTMKRGWYRLAIFPAHAIRALRSLAGRAGQVSERFKSRRKGVR